SRLSRDLPRAAVTPYAADVGHQRDFGHLADRLARGRWSTLQPIEHVPWLRGGDLLHDERGRWLLDHRPHAEDVQEGAGSHGRADRFSLRQINAARWTWRSRRFAVDCLFV